MTALVFKTNEIWMSKEGERVQIVELHKGNIRFRLAGLKLIFSLPPGYFASKMDYKISS